MKILTLFLIFFLTDCTRPTVQMGGKITKEYEKKTNLKNVAVVCNPAANRLIVNEIASELSSRLGQIPEMTVIDRDYTYLSIKEQELSISGLISDDTLVEAGELLGATWMVVCSGYRVNRDIKVDLKVIETKLGKTIISRFYQIPSKNSILLGESIQDFVDELGKM